MEDTLSKSLIANCPACDAANWKINGELQRCKSCGTEVVPKRREFIYAEAYQQERGHYNQQTRDAKVETFQRFLKDANVSLKKQDVILEVGFGGGAVLEHLCKNHPQVFGIEAHEEAINALVQKNISRNHLAVDLKSLSSLQKPIDVLFYLDSFEHLLDPKQHLSELASSAQKGTRAVLVLPRVDSASRSLLGSLWPHNVPDHWVFYSKKGLILLWEKHGWRPTTSWEPRKKLTCDMVLRHVGVKGIANAFKPLAHKISLWIRLGEMGVVFEKN